MSINEENSNGGGWDSEREKALSAREKAVQEYEATQIEKGLIEAFKRAGGRQPAIWDSPDEVPPLVAVQQMFKDKLAFTSSGIIIKGEQHPNGKQKTLDDKFKELKSTQISGYLFSTPEPQQQQQTKPSYTREQARLGKADINAIARGEADIK